MSQESDGSTDPNRDNLDQLIQGLHDAELSGAFLPKPEFLRVLHNEDATEREPASASEDIEPSSDEQVSSEAFEPVHNSSALATRQDVPDQPSLSSDAIPLGPIAQRTRKRKTDYQIHFPEPEAPKPQVDHFAGISRERIEFEMDGRPVVLKVDDLKKHGQFFGRGSFGSVIKVEVNGDPKSAVAAKCLMIPANDEQKCKKLCKEVTTMQTVAHNGRCPHIIIYHGVLLNTSAGELCLLLKLMDSNLLKAYQKLHRMTPFDKHRLNVLLRRVAYNVVSALKFMSGHGLSHNDVKPENILLNRQGDVVLADFGESDYINDGTVPHTYCPGTPYYWPPEYTLKQRMCSSDRSNLYALGLTLVEMCLGRHPYPMYMDGFALDGHIQSWRPSLPLDKVSEESAQFILDLLHERQEAPFTSYSDILNSTYLANMTSEPSQDEIELFRLLIE